MLMDFKKLTKKPQSQIRLLSNICDFGKEIHRLALGLKNLKKI
jgi:hypothetical protein